MLGNLSTFLNKYFSRLTIPKLMVGDVVEILLIAFVVYHVAKWIKSTRAWYLVKGIVILLIIWLIASVFEFNAIIWIFVNTINVGIIALFIIFQPELRRALEQLGQKRLVNFISDGKNTAERFSDQTKDEIVTGVFEMAKVKTGALIIMEELVSLEEYEKTGIPLDSIVSAALLINVFEHNTPLHDGAVIIRGNRAVAATCILPVSDNMRLSKELGTRHRAGVGVSEVTDCLTIIVSEETGKVSIAQKGQLIRGVDAEYLRTKLTEIQNKNTQQNNYWWMLRKDRGNHERKA